MSERLRLWLERGGSGYWLRDAETGEPVRWSDERLRVVKVAGTSYRADALQDPAFAPGSPVALVREPDNPHDPNAVAVWDEARRLQVGYVPADVAATVRGDEQAVVLWEFREDGRRIGLRVLLAPSDAWIGCPRALTGESGGAPQDELVALSHLHGSGTNSLRFRCTPAREVALRGHVHAADLGSRPA